MLITERGGLMFRAGRLLASKNGVKHQCIRMEDQFLLMADMLARQLSPALLHKSMSFG